MFSITRVNKPRVAYCSFTAMITPAPINVASQTEMAQRATLATKFSVPMEHASQEAAFAREDIQAISVTYFPTSATG